VLNNVNGEIILFEAFYPEKIQVVSHCWDVIYLGVDFGFERLIVLTSSGNIQAIPYNIKAPDGPIHFVYKFK
jgi:hypothetical protein